MDFRNLHPRVELGTASDRYAGWLGQIYSPGRYEGQIVSRKRSIGGRAFREEVLPVGSVEEYFEHFPVLELDYTFYRPLLADDGRPTENFHLLGKYRQHLKGEEHLVLKVPQRIFARKVRRGKAYVANEDYLNPDFFTRRFYEPVVRLLGPHVSGFIFEQEYQRSQERSSPEEVAVSLKRFFQSIPRDERYHVELRTGSYLAEPVFEVFEKHGVGQVLSHWTWLPRLSEQFSRSGRRFFNPSAGCLIRLLTPRGMRYEDSYLTAFPFDKLVDGMLSSRMVDETAELMWAAVRMGIRVTVIVNNRAGGNAPLLAEMIAGRFKETEQQGHTSGDSRGT